MCYVLRSHEHDSPRSTPLVLSLSLPQPFLSLSLSPSVSSERSGQAGNAPRRQRAFSPSPCSRMDHRRNGRTFIAMLPDAVIDGPSSLPARVAPVTDRTGGCDSEGGSAAARRAYGTEIAKRKRRRLCRRRTAAAASSSRWGLASRRRRRAEVERAHPLCARYVRRDETTSKWPSSWTELVTEAMT